MGRETVDSTSSEDLEPPPRRWYQIFNDEPNGDTSRWLVLLSTTIGGLIASCQSSALIIALPSMLFGLEADFVTVIWIILAFMLVTTALVPILGRFGDVIGRCWFYNVGYLIFGLGSLLGGVASREDWHGWDVVVYRIVQGVGCALIFANATPLVVDSFFTSGQLGLVIGVNMLSIAAGFVIGPVMGGGLTSISWTWVFLINIPFCVVLGGIGFWKMRDTKILKERLPKSKQERLEAFRKFDYVGSFLITLLLICLLVDLSESAFPSVSLGAEIALAVISVVSLVLFVVWELKIKNPLFDLSLFKIRLFLVGNIANALLSYSQSGVLYTVLFFFQGPYGLSPLNAGIYMIPYGGGIMIMGLLAGWLYDKFGAKILSVVGPIIVAGGTAGLAVIHPDTSYGLIFLYLFLVGLGSGLFNSPNATSIMACVPLPQRGNASSIRTMLSNLLRMVSIAVSFALAFGKLPQTALVQIFLIGGGISDPNVTAIFMSGVSENLWVSFATSVVAGLVCLFFYSNDFIKPPKYEFYSINPSGVDVETFSIELEEEAFV